MTRRNALVPTTLIGQSVKGSTDDALADAAHDTTAYEDILHLREFEFYYNGQPELIPRIEPRASASEDGEGKRWIQRSPA
jgi:hypothetical protein